MGEGTERYDSIIYAMRTPVDIWRGRRRGPPTARKRAGAHRSFTSAARVDSTFA